MPNKAADSVLVTSCVRNCNQWSWSRGVMIMAGNAVSW